jgi:hypothetical protein
MKSKVVMALLVVAAMALMAAAAAPPQEKLLCISKTELRGQETVASCVAKGERFAVVDPYGLVRILTPEEVELSKAFNPKVFETRAYGVRYFKEAPAVPPLPVTPEAP